MKIRDLGEFRFIDRIKQGCVVRPGGVIKAIDDDCCVFRTPERKVNLLTTDMLVEDIHFLRDAIPAFTLGRKSLAVNISDIAAMGGVPGEAVVSLAIPETLEVEYLDQFYQGMRSICSRFFVNILGGDTTSSPQRLVVNIALTGWAAEDQVLYRDGARPGDVVFLTGHVGSSAAGLDIVLKKREFAGKQEFLDAHFDPRPQVKEGRIIAGLKAAHSLIDVSDGVASDLGHICRQSGVGVVLDWGNIPVTETFRKYCAEFREDPERLALHVGEDYVLLGTHPADKTAIIKGALLSQECEYFPVGVTVEESGIRLKMPDGTVRSIEARGYDHFRK